MVFQYINSIEFNKKKLIQFQKKNCMAFKIYFFYLIPVEDLKESPLDPKQQQILFTQASKMS